MNQANLKRVRIIVAALVALLAGFMFMDFSNALPAPVIGAVTFLQFAPSLIKFIGAPALAAAGFAAVIIITIFYGRVYCSTICPLGTLQDAVTRCRLKKKRFAIPSRAIG